MINIKPSFTVLKGFEPENIKIIEEIGRVCYKSEDNITEDSYKQFIKGIINRGHESVLEHSVVTVRIVCDRGVSHELVRHRIASFSQESTRYCNYTNEKFGAELTFIDIAGGFKYDLTNENDVKKYEIWNKAMEDSQKAYFEMVELGAKPQEARSVLPNSLKTEIVITMNFRAWRHFFSLRYDQFAHPQMVEITEPLLKEFQANVPIMFDGITFIKTKPTV